MNKKLAPIMRGLCAVMAALFVIATLGTGIAESYRSALDSVL